MEAVGRTAETLRTRWYQISRFSRFADKPMDAVTGNDVIAYFLNGAEMDLEAKRNMRSCIKMFYVWAIKNGLASANPIDEVPIIPMQTKGGLICPEHAINEGLKSDDEDAVLAIMFGAWMGLRRIEMTRIHTERDIEDNPEEMRILVHGKGIKERVLPVPGELARKIRRRPAGWLFPGRFEENPASVDYVAKRIKAATSYPSHSLRRRFATLAYYRTGCDILLVSQILGHANVATTMRYIGVRPDEMRDAVESTTRTDTYQRMMQERFDLRLPNMTMQRLTFAKR
ncbi:site-specific integrase [Bifidobacterium lemurum]|nr:site-specific integrase [Bifidobacterium lemurum]